MNRWAMGFAGAVTAFLLELLAARFFLANGGFSRAVQIIFYGPTLLVHWLVPVDQSWLPPEVPDPAWRTWLNDYILFINWLLYMALGFGVGWWVGRLNDPEGRGVG